MVEAIPNVKLAKQKLPLQKIVISHMPTSLYDELRRRAGRLNRRVNIYCRIVLEHAMTHKDDYTGLIGRDYDDQMRAARDVSIPVVDKAFLDALVAWDPYGVEKKTKIALGILKKHVEVRSW